jgi:hypothetical protein
VDLGVYLGDVLQLIGRLQAQDLLRLGQRDTAAGLLRLCIYNTNILIIK